MRWASVILRLILGVVMLGGLFVVACWLVLSSQPVFMLRGR
jgi:hypothetical protein